MSLVFAVYHVPWSDPDPAHHAVVGALLPWGAAAGLAISSVVVKRIRARGAELQVAAWQLLMGGTALVAMSAVIEPGAAIRWTPPFVGFLLFLAVIGTAMTTVVWYWLVQRDDVGRLSIALFFVPAAGLGLGVMLFGERLERAQVAGIGLILSALVVVMLGGATTTQQRQRPGPAGQESDHG
jgi:probable blue pigment (indigoidine) exporter